MLNFVLMRSAISRGVALYAPWGETACYVHTIPAIFCAIPDRASVHTHQQGFRREAAPGRCRRWSVGISDRFFVRLWCIVNRYSDSSGNE